MPLLFIHGVNTRQDANYAKNVATRNALIKRLVLEPLGLGAMEIITPYWGDMGVKFAWNLAVLPSVNLLDHLGIEEAQQPRSDQAVADVVRTASSRPPSLLEPQGANAPPLAVAARHDLPQLMQAILAPLVLRESAEGEAGLQIKGDTPDTAGQREALLLLAADQVGHDASIQKEAGALRSNQEVADYLSAKVKQRFKEIDMPSQPCVIPAEETDTQGAPLPVREQLGGGIWSDLNDRIGEFFNRAVNAPTRAATVGALQFFRAGANANITRFVGDVFVYINTRDGIRDFQTQEITPAQTIVEFVKDQLEAARAKAQERHEPLLVITHSMGGNILYDLLTSYDKPLELDFWASVAAQVGLFEEMKIFKASDPAVNANSKPNRVKGLKPNVGYWVNIYDPADIFSFKTAPVFSDVDKDEPYLTGMSTLDAHSAYFLQPSFYNLVYQHVKKALAARETRESQAALQQPD